MRTADLADRLLEHPDRRLRFALGRAVETRTFAALHRSVTLRAEALARAGLGPRDAVGILGPNSEAWIVTDLALLRLGCVPVALPVEQGAPADVQALMDRYDLAALLVGRAVPTDGPLPRGAAPLEDLGPALEARSVPPALPDEVATVVFSSGTAGTRKGLMLTEAGVVNTVVRSAAAWDVGPEDDVLVTMPLSAFQQRWLLYMAIWVGCDATVVAPERLFSQLRVLEPTIILGPPSFFDVVASRVRGASSAERRRHRAAALLLAVGPESWTRPLRARLGARWTAMYGRRARLLLTGSAPVSTDLVHLFRQLGRPLLEVYGTTEVGWIALSTTARSRVGTAGRPIDGVEVAIAEDGEVVVRSAHPQACGYVYDGVEATTTTFLSDGTIATGDLGRIDRSGFLHLVGRKTNVVITRSGVKVNPEEIERRIEAECVGARAMVTASRSGATLTGVVWVGTATDGDATRRAVEAAVSRVNGAVPGSHRIGLVVVRPLSELTVDNGLLTRTLKVDRSAVVANVLGTEKIV